MWKLPCMGRVDSKVFESWPQGVGWDPIGNQNFTLKYISKIFKNHFLTNYWARKAQCRF